MTDQKIYPLNPIFETATRDGRKAWVAFYRPDGEEYAWTGHVETIRSPTGWYPDGQYVPDHDGGKFDLTSVPEIPPEAREPKPGEVWEMWNEEPAIFISQTNDAAWRYINRSGVFVGERDSFRRPWPNDKPHGFEGLINAILQAHGGKP